MQPLTLALLQTPTHWHDPDRNRHRFGELLAQVSESVDVVVLPEMFSTGFTMASAQVAESMSGPTRTWMANEASRRKQVVCGSLVIEESGQFFNRFVWQTPDGNYEVYDKRHRFRMAGEHQHYAAGTRRAIIHHAGWALRPAVCYDLRFPVWLRQRNDCDVMLCVANWPAARRTAWRVLLQARAVENQCYAIGVNILGVDGNGVEYAGGSVVFGPEGQLMLDAGDQPGVYEVTLDHQEILELRKRFPAWQDADDFQLD